MYKKCKRRWSRIPIIDHRKEMFKIWNRDYDWNLKDKGMRFRNLSFNYYLLCGLLFLIHCLVLYYYSLISCWHLFSLIIICWNLMDIYFSSLLQILNCCLLFFVSNIIFSCFLFCNLRSLHYSGIKKG